MKTNLNFFERLLIWAALFFIRLGALLESLLKFVLIILAIFPMAVSSKQTRDVWHALKIKPIEDGRN